MQLPFDSCRIEVPSYPYHLTQRDLLPSKDTQARKGGQHPGLPHGIRLFARFSRDRRGYGPCSTVGLRSYRMEINRAAFGALAVIGVIAAGGGAYLANRHSDAASVPAASSTLAPAEGVVTETENASLPHPQRRPRGRSGPIVERPPVRQPTVRRTQTRPPSAPVAEAERTTQRPSPAPPADAPMDPPVAAAIEPLDSTTVERAPVRAGAPTKDVRRARHSGRFGHRPAG